MRKIAFLSSLFFGAFLLFFVLSCGSSGGGGGGGGNNSQPQTKSTVTIKIGADSSSDILPDITDTDIDGFWYDVHFTGEKYTSPTKGGKKGDEIKFEDVPFGTYNFYLDIFSNDTKNVQLGSSLTKSVAVSSAANTVVFNPQKSNYKNYYFVSSAERLEQILLGKNADNTSINTSTMNKSDEATWGKVYFMQDVTLSGQAGADNVTSPIAISYENPVCVSFDLQGKKLIANTNIYISKNVHFIIKNGTVSFAQGCGFSLQSSSADAAPDASAAPSLELSAVTLDGHLYVSYGTCALTNGSSVQAAYASGDDNQARGSVYLQKGGTFVMNGASKIKNPSEDTQSVHCAGGTFVMLGGEAESVKLCSTDQYGNCVLALGNQSFVAGSKTYEATGKNRITGKLEFNAFNNGDYATYLMLGGDSNIAELNLSNLSVDPMFTFAPIYIVQISSLSGDAAAFVTTISGLNTSANPYSGLPSATPQAKILKPSFTLPALPFAAVEPTTPVKNYFPLPLTSTPDDTMWQWQDQYQTESYNFYRTWYYDGDA